MIKLHYQNIDGFELFYHGAGVNGSGERLYNIIVKSAEISAGWRNVSEPVLQRLQAYVENVAAIAETDLRPYAVAALETFLKSQIRA